MRFRILGRLEVLDGERRLAVGGDKQRALLALLLIHANEAMSAERLIDELWGERPPQTAAKTLQVYISRIRKALAGAAGDGGLVVTREHGYELSVDRECVDSLVFERLADEGRGALATGRVGRACSLLEEALSLWRGPPLAEFAYERFAEVEIARLAELRIGAQEELIESKLAMGRHAEVVGELESMISEHPYRERLRAQLMLALYRCDRQAEALQAYQDARYQLVEELGIEPGERLRELERAILAQDPALAFVEQEESFAERAEISRGAFVGRERELRELIACLDDAFAGRGRLALLVGEPGIGKSRLAEELIAWAQARGARVLVGRCWEAGGAPAYWPWVQSLRAHVRESEMASLCAELGDGAAELAQLIPELRRRLPEIGEPPALDPELARFRLFDAATEFLGNASRSRPLVLALDDLHAADAPSLLLLRFLARELSRMRVLVLAVYRDVDPVPGKPLADMISEVTREPVTRRIALRGLSAREVEQYVQVAAAQIASSGLAATLHAETEGNPLFLGEIVRLLLVDGAPSGSADGAALVIPQTVIEVIARRLARLSPECQQLLELGSVIGREFEPQALAGASGASEEELLELLDEASAARVVLEVPGEGGRLRFAHVLLRDTLYEGLAAARRVRLHRDVLGALEALYSEDPGPHLPELAHHAIAGHDRDSGVSYARQAGERALALLAYEEAARLYELGLKAVDEAAAPAPAERFELLLGLGHAQLRSGDLESAKQTFLRAAAIARRLERSEALARAALGYGGRFVWARAGADENLLGLLREPLAAGDLDDPTLRARVLARLATALRDERDPTTRERLSEEALNVARGVGDPSTLAYALVARCAAIWSPENADERLAITTELIELAKSSGDKERETEGHGYRFQALLELGEVERASADVEARARLTKEMRQPASLWVQLVLASQQHLLAGEFEPAEETIHQALELGERAQGEEARAVFELQRFVLRREQGRLTEIQSALERCVSVHPARPVFRCVLTNFSAELGRLDEARHRLAALASDDFCILPRDAEWLFEAALLAETCGFLDDRSYAAPLYRLLLTCANRNVGGGVEVSTGAVSRYLGILATSMGSFGAAVRHFEHGLAMNTRMGALPWVAHTQDDYARMLLARGQDRDREQGLELIQAALTTYRQLGMESRVERASELERELRLDPPPGR